MPKVHAGACVYLHKDRAPPPGWGQQSQTGASTVYKHNNFIQQHTAPLRDRTWHFFITNN